MPADWLAGLAGGALLGLAATLLLALEGRIAGISGIVGGLVSGAGDRAWRVAFVLGLPAGAGFVALVTGNLPQVLTESPVVLVAAGLLVGVGTRLGGGCTSGHGICGLARRSPRSLVATVVFMTAGVLTVYVARHLWA
jgi:uncharacterized membrane protein YedE/YeeE